MSAGFVFVKNYGVRYLGADGYVDNRNSSNYTEEGEEEEEYESQDAFAKLKVM